MAWTMEELAKAARGGFKEVEDVELGLHPVRINRIKEFDPKEGQVVNILVELETTDGSRNPGVRKDINFENWEEQFGGDPSQHMMGEDLAIVFSNISKDNFAKLLMQTNVEAVPNPANGQLDPGAFLPTLERIHEADLTFNIWVSANKNPERPQRVNVARSS